MGVILVAGPTLRLTEKRMLQLGPQLLETARELAAAGNASAFLKSAPVASMPALVTLSSGARAKRSRNTSSASGDRQTFAMQTTRMLPEVSPTTRNLPKFIVNITGRHT